MTLRDTRMTRERKYFNPIIPTASGSGVVAEAEAVVVDEPKLKCGKVKGTAKGTELRETETIAKGLEECSCPV
jgi:hypothetical protein